MPSADASLVLRNTDVHPTISNCLRDFFGKRESKNIRCYAVADFFECHGSTVAVKLEGLLYAT
ncbi:hypothetical protein H9L39_18556, partial [Fusarium oxysporum f. sp. albedinis]